MKKIFFKFVLSLFLLFLFIYGYLYITKPIPQEENPAFLTNLFKQYDVDPKIDIFQYEASLEQVKIIKELEKNNIELRKKTKQLRSAPLDNLNQIIKYVNLSQLNLEIETKLKEPIKYLKAPEYYKCIGYWIPLGLKNGFNDKCRLKELSLSYIKYSNLQIVLSLFLSEDGITKKRIDRHIEILEALNKNSRTLRDYMTLATKISSLTQRVYKSLEQFGGDKGLTAYYVDALKKSNLAAYKSILPALHVDKIDDLIKFQLMNKYLKEKDFKRMANVSSLALVQTDTFLLSIGLNEYFLNYHETLLIDHKKHTSFWKIFEKYEKTKHVEFNTKYNEDQFAIKMNVKELNKVEMEIIGKYLSPIYDIRNAFGKAYLSTQQDFRKYVLVYKYRRSRLEQFLKTK